MKKNYKLWSIVAMLATLLSGCDNVGKAQDGLEVERQVIARKGLEKSSVLQNSSVGINFKDIAYGNNMYMVVGSNGAIYTSPDALQWTERVGVTTTDLNAVAYNNTYKKFYAVGSAGKVFTSEDGIVWLEYKTLNRSVDLTSISVLSDGNEVIGGSGGSLFEIEFRNGGEKSTVAVREMQSKDGDDNSTVNAVATNSLNMIAGSNASSLSSKEVAEFRHEDWVYSGSNNATGISDVAFDAKHGLFFSLSKDGYINSTSANTYNAPWSTPLYTNYPDKMAYSQGVSTNSVAVDATSGYAFIVGGSGKDKKDTFIHYSKNLASWDSKNTLYPANTGALNKVRCFAEDPEPMCIAVGDDKAIVIIKIKDDEVTPVPIDITDPKIIAFVPENNAKGVDVNPLMDITFNKPVTNVNASNITLYEDHIASDSKVNLSNFEPSDNYDDYIFEPAHKLKGNTNYLVVVESGITDKYGKRIVGKTYKFTTGIASFPEVKSVNPANGQVAVSTSPTIEVVFSEPVLNVDTKNVTMHINSPSGSKVAISAPLPKGSVDYVFSPVDKLNPLTKYCVVFAPGITDVYGTSIKEYTSCFTTGAVNAPTVAMLAPENNAIDVSLMPVLKFKFSKAVAGVNLQNIVLHKGSPSGDAVKLGAIAIDGNVYSANVESLLQINTNYYLVFSDNIKDAEDENNSLETTVYSFKTRGDGIAAVASSETCMYTYSYTGNLTCVKKVTNSIYKVIYSRNYDRFIAVGAKGLGYTSNNGTDWLLNSLGDVKKTIRAITVLNSTSPIVAAVGDQGAIIVSKDMGLTWSVKTSPLGTKDLKNIYSDGKEFSIAVDGTNWLYSDDNGDTWSIKTGITPLPQQGTQNIFTDNGSYNFVGGANGLVYASTDGMKSWLPQTSVLYKAPNKTSYSTFNDYLYIKNIGLNLLLGNNNTLFVAHNEDVAQDKWTRITSFDTTPTVVFQGASVNSYGMIYLLTIEGSNEDGAMYLSQDGLTWLKLVKLKDNSFFSVATLD